MTDIQPVIVGKLSDEHAARLRLAKKVRANAEEASKIIIKQMIEGLAHNMAEYHTLMDELWTDVCRAHGLTQERNGRYGLDPKPDGTVDIVDVEATHALNCPSHGPQCDGKAN